MFDDKKDDERFKNLIFFNTYATDEEIDRVMPVVAVLVLIIAVVGGLIWWLS